MAEQLSFPLGDFEESGTTTHSTSADVMRRLAELGLDMEVLEQAVHHGHNGAERATALHAKTAAGTYRWNETVAALRAELVERGWIPSDVKNAPRILNEEKNVSIMVATGDQNTGTSKIPKNATSKGSMTQADVWNNGNQLVIEEVASLLAEKSPATWVLLYFYSRQYNHIRLELSLPSGMENGFISEWEERIILPKIDLGDSESLFDAQPDNTTPEIRFDIGDADAV